MNLKIGLEKEFFLLDEEGKPQIICKDFNLPYDECGWLVEARGLPFVSITEAVFSLKADIFEIEQKVKNIRTRTDIISGTGDNIVVNQGKYKLDDTPVMVIDRDVRAEASRHFTKPLVKYGNFYGYKYHSTKSLEATAGVHISFTNSQEVSCVNSSSNSPYKQTFNLNFDWPHIFISLDKAFEAEIKAAKRKPGFYEIKADGRVEYRSLPSNVDLDKVIFYVKKLIF